MAGATAIQIGSGNLIDPYICRKVIDDLPNLMDKLEINKLEEIIGGAHL